MHNHMGIGINIFLEHKHLPFLQTSFQPGSHNKEGGQSESSTHSTIAAIK